MSDQPIRIGSPRDFVRRNPVDPSLAQGKVQPQANDVEEVVLGAIMLDKDAISVVLDILQPESFYTEGHQAIYRSMLTLFDKNSAIDLLTVKEQLSKSGELDKAGGPYRLVQLSNRVGSAANIEYHARIIAQKSIARELIKASGEVLRDAYDETIDVFDLLDDAEKKIFKITEDKLSRGVESIAELGPKALKMLEEIKAKSNESGGLTGVPTGFIELDKVTNGWQPSDLIVLAARPGMGKCLGLGTPVMMYDGTVKAVEDIRVGDLLMGDDSTPRTVLSLARGREEMYWVRQTFGEDYRVNASHILTVRPTAGSEAVLDIELREWRQLPAVRRAEHRGFKVAVEFDYRDVEVEPYEMGWGLGSGIRREPGGSALGSFCNPPGPPYFLNFATNASRLSQNLKNKGGGDRGVSLRSEGLRRAVLEGADFEGGVQRCTSTVASPLVRVTAGAERSEGPGRHTDKGGRGGYRRMDGLTPYIVNSRSIRLQFLAGLLDVQGELNDSAELYTLRFDDPSLAHDIKLLCDTLGYRTFLRKHNSYEESLSAKLIASETWTLSIAGDIDEIPIRHPNLRARPWPHAEIWRNSTLTLEPDGVGDYYGFTIDGNRRFLLGDGTVTHNTAFVLSIARNAAMDFGKGVAIFSLEMANVQLVQRLLSMEAQVDSKKMRSGQLSEEEWDKLQQGIERLSAAPIYIDDTPAINIFELRAKCRRLKMQHDIQMVIIDYLQLMSGNSSGKQTNREQEISAISRNLKQLAKEIGVPVIALSQLSRAVEQRGGDKRPMLSDLRECVPGHTLVCLADGRRVPIRDLVGTTPRVLSKDESGHIVEANSDLVWPVGVKKTYAVTLRSGRRIEATAEHRLYRYGGWAAVAELGVGDRLATARSLPEPAETETWPDEAVALLGQMIGDGSYIEGSPMRFTSNSEDNLAAVAAGAAASGCTTRRYDNPGWSQLLISGNGNRWEAAGVNAWLRELGVFGQRSHEKRVPARAFRLGNRQIALLLRHLWATDGTIYTRREGSRGGHAIQYATDSRALAGDVAALLSRLGIVAAVTCNQKGEHKPGYLVMVRGCEQQRRFLEAVGGFGPREPQAVKLDTVPHEVFVQVKRHMRSKGISQRAKADLRGTSYGGTAHFKFAPSRETLADYATLLRDDDLMRQATSDLFWDEIVSIEFAGEQEVFDLTVPGPSCWLADGIVSHNSGAIEQDADMVNFIYRPEYYDIDQDEDGNSLKGVAKIIIAKNRHGELRDVTLRWIANQARFDNFEAVDFNSFKPNLSPFTASGFGAEEGSVTLQSRVNTDDEEIMF